MRLSSAQRWRAQGLETVLYTGEDYGKGLLGSTVECKSAPTSTRLKETAGEFIDDGREVVKMNCGWVDDRAIETETELCQSRALAA